MRTLPQFAALLLGCAFAAAACVNVAGLDVLEFEGTGGAATSSAGGTAPSAGGGTASAGGAPAAGGGGGADGGGGAGGMVPSLLGDCLVPLTDTFDDGVLNTALWTETSDGASVVEEGNGLAFVQVPASAPSNYAFFRTVADHDISDCAFFLEFVAVEEAPHAVTFMSFRDGMGNDAGWEVRDGVLTALSNLEASNMPLHVISYSPVDHRWLALRGDGGTVRWLASADGVAWKELVSVETSVDLSAMELLFGIGAETDGGAIQSDFDNFNTVP